MKHVSIVIPEGDSIVDTIIAPYNLFRMANSHMRRMQNSERDLLQVDIVGRSGAEVTYQGLFSVKPTASFDQSPRTNLIVIAAISGNLKQQIEANRELIAWVRQQREQREQHDVQVASLCKAAFLLAETGLLDGLACTTHWTVDREFRERYPQVELVSDKIICESDGIYSSGGAYSFLNFTIFLIEKLCGRETAVWCSKVAGIEFDRIQQNQFMIFNGQKEHPDETIAEAQLYIENNYRDKLNVDAIAQKFHLNTRSFLRRFKKATSNTPLEYIHRVKIEAAKRKLESTVESISEVMFNVGYVDEKAFRKTFRRYAGLSPSEYRNKYNREFA